MKRSVTATPRDSERLAKFRKAFGFQNGQWFIEKLDDSILAYARSAEVPQDRYIECHDTVESYVDRLNFVEQLKVS